MPVLDNTVSTIVEYGTAMLPDNPVLAKQYSQAKHGMYQAIEPRNLRTPKPVMGKVFSASPVKIGKAYVTGSSPCSYEYQVGTKPYLYKVVLRGQLAEFATSSVPGFSSLQVAMNATMNSSLADASLTKAYAKLSEPDFDLGVNLGELRETIEGLANPLSALRTYGQQMKKLHNTTLKAWQSNRYALIQKKRSSYTLTALGGSWLEWRMGVKPLLQTIEDLKEYLAEQCSSELGHMLRCRASVKKEAEKSVKVSPVIAGQFRVDATALIQEKWRTSSILYYDQEVPLTLGESLGVDAGSVPAVMWELTRLSFVVDRFIRVGEFLQALRPAVQGKQTILGTVTSQKYTADVQVIVNNVWATPVTPRNLPGGAMYGFRVESLIREVNRMKPVLPAINWSPLKLQQQLDHLTLLWQAIPQRDWRSMQNLALKADRELGKVYFRNKRK